jgi:hypothetical protein
MKYIEISGYIDENNRLVLDESLDVIKPQSVKIDIWFRDGDEEEDREESKEEILEGIREGLGDCFQGRISPVEELWDDLAIQTTGSIDDRGRLILDRPLRPTKCQYVDVVIRFIGNEKSKEVADLICPVDRHDRARESIGTEV